VTVVLYDAREFRDVARVHAWVTGLFDGKIRCRSAAPLPARRARADPRHEYAHAAIHDLARGGRRGGSTRVWRRRSTGTPADPLLRVPGRPTLTGLEEMLGDPDPGPGARRVRHRAMGRSRSARPRGHAGDALLHGPARPRRHDRHAVPAVYGLPLVELEHQWRRVLGG
jgi:hypothetical protein